MGLSNIFSNYICFVLLDFFLKTIVGVVVLYCFTNEVKHLVDEPLLAFQWTQEVFILKHLLMNYVALTANI